MASLHQSESANLVDTEWITITEAAKQFARTRAAIEQHIKAGRVESKRLGAKQLIHVHKPSIVNLFASFAKPLHPIEQSKFDESDKHSINHSLQSTMPNEVGILYKSLLEESKKEILELKNDLAKQREENKELQKELLKLMHEMQGLLKKEPGLTGWIRSKIS